MGSPKLLDLPDMIPRFGYQWEGVEFINRVKRCILGDDMGLGKTCQDITASFWGGYRRILIIAPNTLLRNWQREIFKWCPAMMLMKHPVQIVEGTFHEREEQLKSGAIFTLIPYSLIGERHTYREVKKDQWEVATTDPRHVPTLCKIPWDKIAVDEAHRVVNRHTNAFKGLKKINATNLTRSLVLITGTPLLNQPGDLWPALYLINPHGYPSYHDFLEKYCETKPSPYSKFNRVVLGVKDPEEVKALLHPIMIRRLKEDALDLPEKRLLRIEVDLNDDQRQIYDTMHSQFYAEIHGRIIDAPAVIARIVRERQISVSPDLLNPLSDALEGAKIDYALELIKERVDRKVVIFSQFAQVIRRLQYRLKKEKTDYVWFTGQFSSRGDSELDTRESIKNDFNTNSQREIFGVTIQCGGEGHTFTGASIGIMLDFMWSPLRNAQAIDRLHRIGQLRDVDIYILVAKNTVEERVMESLDDKMDLFNAVVPVRRVMQALKQVMVNYYGVQDVKGLGDGEFIYDGS